MPMPPAPSSPPGDTLALQPAFCVQSASVIVVSASCRSLMYWFALRSIAPYPTSETRAPFLMSRRAQPVASARGVNRDGLASTRTVRSSLDSELGYSMRRATCIVSPSPGRASDVVPTRIDVRSGSLQWPAVSATVGATSTPVQPCWPLNSTAATSGHLPVAALAPPTTSDEVALVSTSDGSDMQAAKEEAHSATAAETARMVAHTFAWPGGARVARSSGDAADVARCGARGAHGG